jgi:hypothetical protein
MKSPILTLILGFFLTVPSHAQNIPRACDFFFKTQNLCASLQWMTQPSGMNADGSFRLLFWRKDQSSEVLVAPTAASIGVKLYMPGMGHGGGLVQVTPTHDSNGNVLTGEFDATRVGFMMSGMWEIIVQLRDGSAKPIDSAQINYQAP